MNILKTMLIKHLRDAADALEKNTCELSLEQIEDALKLIAHRPMSKEQASQYLRISRSSFDQKIKEGLLPKGRKRVGFKELVWYEDELEEYINKNK